MELRKIELLRGDYYFSWAGRAIHFVESEAIKRITADLHEVVLCRLPVQAEVPLFCGGGVFVCGSLDGKVVVVYDLLSNAFETFVDGKRRELSRGSIVQSLELSESGLSISAEVLVDIFGPEFLSKRDAVWKAYVSQMQPPTLQDHIQNYSKGAPLTMAAGKMKMATSQLSERALLGPEEAFNQHTKDATDIMVRVQQTIPAISLSINRLIGDDDGTHLSRK